MSEFPSHHGHLSTRHHRQQHSMTTRQACTINNSSKATNLTCEGVSLFGSHQVNTYSNSAVPAQATSQSLTMFNMCTYPHRHTHMHTIQNKMHLCKKKGPAPRFPPRRMLIAHRGANLLLRGLLLRNHTSHNCFLPIPFASYGIVPSQMVGKGAALSFSDFGSGSFRSV